MPRPAIDLEPLREQITAWHESGKRMPEVMQRLQDEYNITIKRTQLHTRYKRWGLKSQENTHDSEALRAQIRELFFHQFLPDDLIVKRLREDGFTISKTRLEIYASIDAWARYLT